MSFPITGRSPLLQTAVRLRPPIFPAHRDLPLHTCHHAHPAARRWESTEAAAAAAPANPKITQIVDQISQLTLLETADFVV